MNGFVLDRNTQFFASELYGRGYRLVESRIVHDDRHQILATWREWAASGDIIINSGGLGPTSDDLTVDLLCEWLGDQAIYEPEAERRTRYFFERRARKNPALSLETALRQARIPSRAIAIQNSVGLAPGIFIPEKNFFALPGFPEEIHAMWPQVLQHIQALEPEKFLTTIIPVWGVGESQLFSGIRETPGVTVGVHALPWGCRLFLRAENGMPQALEKLAAEIRSRYSAQIVEDPLVEVIAHCKKQGLKLAFAESCTGGLAAKRLTDHPGVSAIFQGGVVSYANSAKSTLLGVSQELLATHGAVSREVAEAMARGAAEVLSAELALSFTGIAGPDGGSESKPVGTVYIGLYDRRSDDMRVARFHFPLGRERFRNATVSCAFLALWQYLCGHNTQDVFPLSEFR